MAPCLFYAGCYGNGHIIRGHHISKATDGPRRGECLSLPSSQGLGVEPINGHGLAVSNMETLHLVCLDLGRRDLVTLRGLILGS